MKTCRTRPSRGLWKGIMLAGVIALCAGSGAFAAGLMKPVQPNDASAVKIKSHDVKVTINNGFSRTEVDQVFMNESENDIEAIYTFPVPKEASLSEVSLWIDGNEVIGEVVEKERARQIYEQQVAEGNETALAEKNDFMTFDVSVGKVPAKSETRVRLVYYQPVEIDLNVGRYLYPLAEGNVDDARIPFWSVDDEVRESFTFKLTLKSAFPVKDIRAPGHLDSAIVSKVGEENTESGEVYEVVIDQREGADLSKDVVVYYRLDDSVPARVEIVPYKPTSQDTGTLMTVITPAASLGRLPEGTDWIFVLDISGSMSGNKIATLADGVTRVLGKLSPQDRFRIILFNNSAQDFTGGYIPASPSSVNEWCSRVKAIQSNGGTALFAGLEKAYRSLDDDRTTGIILVTDGVCNVGPTKHDAFIKLIRKYDVRLFTFVIGNSGNQPLMERMALESDGFAMNISDVDDITGRMIQAKAKVLHQCMRNVRVKFKGEKVRELTPDKIGSIYMGRQVILLGRYEGSGRVTLEMTANISGTEQTWTCTAELPEVDTANPELERLWALSRIHETMQEIREKGESKSRIDRVVDLGLEYSLVTDYTSMLVVREDVMENEGIERRNARRTQREREAQTTRASTPVANRRVDSGQQVFQGRRAPNIGTGPIGPLFLGILFWMVRRRRNS